MYCLIDKPKAILPATTKVIIGSETRIDCLVSGCPPPFNIEWQKNIDGTSFIPIDIYMENYFGSIVDQCPPFLLVHNATLNDQQYYRVVVSNRIGKYTSDEVFLQVTGGMLVYYMYLFNIKRMVVVEELLAWKT